MVHYFLRIPFLVQIHILNDSVDETSFMEWKANDCLENLSGGCLDSIRFEQYSLGISTIVSLS